MNTKEDFDVEMLSDDLRLFVSREHKFGTDAFLLSSFASPKKKDRVCDFCTGCGIVALLWFRGEGYPKECYCIDIQEKAISQLQRTVRENKLEEYVKPILADLKTAPSLFKAHGLDLITCNPPYKKLGSGILSEMTAEQIARHEVFCSFDEICESASACLRFGGRFCICQRPERLPDVMGSMVRHGIEPKRLRFVSKNKDTSPWLFLLEGKKGAKPYLTVEPPLFMRDGEGFSQEVLRIYNKQGNLEK